jgi:hypothetical protein
MDALIAAAGGGRRRGIRCPSALLFWLAAPPAKQCAASSPMPCAPLSRGSASRSRHGGSTQASGRDVGSLQQGSQCVWQHMDRAERSTRFKRRDPCQHRAHVLGGRSECRCWWAAMPSLASPTPAAAASGSPCGAGVDAAAALCRDRGTEAELLGATAQRDRTTGCELLAAAATWRPAAGPTAAPAAFAVATVDGGKPHRLVRVAMEQGREEMSPRGCQASRAVCTAHGQASRSLAAPLDVRPKIKRCRQGSRRSVWP